MKSSRIEVMDTSLPRLRSRQTGASRSIGSILLDSGRLSPEDAERVLRLQKEEGLRFGAAGVRLGLLTEDDIRQALSHQFDYPYLSREDTALHEELAAAYEPFSPSVENLRALRSQLMLRWFDGDTARKALAVISVDSEDGRSYLAANLAIVFSQLGERTLIIDADLRKPRQHQLFKLQDGPGLSTVLAERSSLDAISNVPALVGLSVLQAGPIPPNPQELLGRSTFTDMLTVAAMDYDVIIIDTPPAARYADAQTIAVRAGAALLVARKNKSSLPGLNQLNQNLQQFGATVVGSVLNDS